MSDADQHPQPGGHGAAGASQDGHSGGDPVATLLVLGASGDLASRLLLPGLARLLVSGRSEDATHGHGSSLQLVGAGAEDWDDAHWREVVTEAFSDHGADPAEDDGAARAVRDGSRYAKVDVTDPDALLDLLHSCTAPVAAYFALPPAITAKACEGLVGRDLPESTRLVMEKPFGSDEASAHHLNEVVARLVPEQHVHRVDHFLGTSTVLGTLGVRFANRLFEPTWNAAHVERVDVFYDEDLALEGRARYYDHAGALVDMIQSHLLQVLSVLTMDAPSSLDEREFRDRKAQLLRATRLAGPPAEASRRARYTAGRIGDRDLPDYTFEDGVDPARQTETLAEVVLHVDTWRWAGVPFRLRSGKALGRARKEAVITYKPVPHLMTGLKGNPAPTRLRLGFKPDTVNLDLTVNAEGDPFDLEEATLTAQLADSRLPAYGEVLAGVLDGDPLLSVRGDTAEDCWRILAPVIAAWKADEVPLETYAAGSDGPEPTEWFPAV
ncbi:glucose-6-phosphate dehydrogenase [Kineococcus rhizosphaerae]|uniref:Glucose-6-phosphate 1-dehydrogenase n=1 Tax=Kineococcus rhizosphaerae TaxID=559628 RepID=A0A2T0QXG7_9ACTN|nr:glucose-6-phosphate dehydrogenase [Kineococcus rhizosphaerae]PRY10471.1 glucose-6-phosphate 1-dehydrogenase [Kineococcus rhizosphaerae]